MAGVRLAEKNFVLDALEQALHARCGTTLPGLVHSRDRGTQYLSMRYTDRWARARTEPQASRRTPPGRKRVRIAVESGRPQHQEPGDGGGTIRQQ